MCISERRKRHEIDTLAKVFKGGRTAKQKTTLSGYPQGRHMRKILLSIVTLAALAGIGAGGYAWYQHAQSAEGVEDIAASDIPTPNNDIAPSTGNATPLSGPQSTPVAHGGHDHATPQADPSLAKPDDVHITVDGVDPKAPRSIGKLDAPVTMIEYSSLTCPHCASAHATVLPQMIKDYVETGKLRIVFSDFPLNKPALDASKVSRCVANDQYFGFLTMLFGSIEQWAYTNNHPNALIQTATLTGLSADKARECMNDTNIEAALIKGVQDAIAKYKVESTPTFILNDGAATIAGARPYAEFKAAIDALIAEKK
jgi:protein-disulfide isomerase